jgi:hypothetical protein
MTRKTHLVGAWPGRDPEHAMQTALEQLAPHLDRMTDGETGDRHLWATPAIDALRANPDVEIVKDGDWNDYDDVAQFIVRDGATLNPDNIRLPYSGAFEWSFPAFKILRERYDRPDLRFQIGLPTPIDMAVFAFGEAAFGDADMVVAFTEATVREVGRIFDVGGDEVVFQLEDVVGLVGVAQAPDEASPAVAGQMAHYVTAVAARAPAGARFGIHLCLGDFRHEAIARMRDVRPLVLMANEIASGWPDDRPLDYVHAPFAAAAEPPIPDEEWYAPLADLRLPEDTRFIAGFIHESLDLEAHRELLERIETLTGRDVDVAAACGLGRRPTPDQAWDAMSKAVALIEQPTTVP